MVDANTRMQIGCHVSSGAHVKIKATGLGWINEEIGVVQVRDKMLPSEVGPAETGRFCSNDQAAHEIDVRKSGHNPFDAQVSDLYMLM